VGLTVTRAMLAPPYADAKRLVLISEGGEVPGARHTIPAALLEYWKAHNNTMSGLAGYRWDAHGTGWSTAAFGGVVGAAPRIFLLHRIREWKPADARQDLAVVGRLKPGVTAATAQNELRDLAAQYNPYRRLSAADQAQVMPLVGRTRKPFWAYGWCAPRPCCCCWLPLASACARTGGASAASGGGIGPTFARSRCCLPLTLALVIWNSAGRHRLL